MHTDTVSAHLHRLNWLLRARVVEAKLRELERAVKAGFDRNQPRVPAGSPDGGQWRSASSGCDAMDLSMSGKVRARSVRGQAVRVSAALLLSALSLSAGIPLATADEIALSFVHEENRIDVPASAIDSIEALHYSLYRNTETGKVFKGARPNVEICFDGGIGASLCELTKKICR